MNDSTTLDGGLRLRTGDLINGRFELISKLGKGGLSRVWRARHTVGGFDIALKFVDPAHDSLGRDEFRLLANLYHPNVVRIMDIQLIGDIYTNCVAAPVSDTHSFISMEYIEGHTLLDYAAGTQPFRGNDALIWLRQMVTVLSYLHSDRVWHRDVKPANIVTDVKSLTPRAVLIDFNLSNISNPQAGTPRYKCPAVLAEGRWSPLADIWSLAVTFYELLTRTFLFIGEAPSYEVELAATPVVPFPAVTFSRLCEIIHGEAHTLISEPQNYGNLFALPRTDQVVRDLPQSVCVDYGITSVNQRFVVIYMLTFAENTPRSRKTIVREALIMANMPAGADVVDELLPVFYQLKRKGIIEYHGQARSKKVALTDAFLRDFEKACAFG